MKPDHNENIPQNKMGTKSMKKLMIEMSLPAIISMIIMSLYNIISNIFVAMLGEAEFTAVTLVFPIQLLIIALGAGTGVGLNSLISRRLGERNFKEANMASTHGLLLSLVNWLVFLIFGIFFSSLFISAFTDNPKIIEDGANYCTIVTVFSLFIFIQINVEKILQATGNMIFPMMCNILGAVTNIILNPILIFGLLGAPKMGVEGAAVATIIAQFLAMSMSLVLLFSYKHEVHISFKNFKIDWMTLKNIYSVGLPSIVMHSIGSVMLFGLNSILISFSEAAVAVLGVYYRLQSIIFMPVFGLTQGAMPIFGYNFGAKNKERLIQAFKLSLKMALVIMIIGMIIFQLFPIPLLKLFSASEEMINIGVRALRIISTCFIFAAIGIMTSTMFQATNHGILSAIVSLLRQLILILPMAWLLGRFQGLDYVWFAFPLAELFSVIASLWFFRYIYIKEIKELGSIQ